MGQHASGDTALCSSGCCLTLSRLLPLCAQRMLLACCLPFGTFSHAHDRSMRLTHSLTREIWPSLLGTAIGVIGMCMFDGGAVVAVALMASLIGETTRTVGDRHSTGMQHAGGVPSLPLWLIRPLSHSQSILILMAAAASAPLFLVAAPCDASLCLCSASALLLCRPRSVAARCAAFDRLLFPQRDDAAGVLLTGALGCARLWCAARLPTRAGRENDGQSETNDNKKEARVPRPRACARAAPQRRPRRSTLMPHHCATLGRHPQHPR